AVSPDGKTAASGYIDGKVQFFGLPGPAKSAFIRRFELLGQVNGLLRDEKYDELDVLANEALTQTHGDRADFSPADIMLDQPFSATRQSIEEHREFVERFAKWRTAKPQSRAAKLMSAEAITDYGWRLRGGDVAARTGQDAMRQFQEQLTKSDELLEELE